jgi:[methyl-Co(III) methanol-specific corrinoid protein]:coenzyme M methyltransferase
LRFYPQKNTFWTAPIDRIQNASRNLLDCGIDILAPACGLSAGTPVKHIKAMTAVTKSV